MFLFHKATASIQYQGTPAVSLRGLAVTAVIDVEGEIALKLKTTEVTPLAEAIVEYRLHYEDESGDIGAELRMSGSGRLLTVSVDAQIRNLSAYHTQRNFAAEAGIRLTIGGIEGLRGLMAIARHKEWWTRPHFELDIRKLPSRTQALLWKTDGGYGYLLPLCNGKYRTDLAGTDQGMSILVSALEAGHERIRTCAFVLGADENPYRLAADAVREGYNIRESGGTPRAEKAYPEIMEYLGWCSWDAFYSDINEEAVTRKVAEFKAMELPVLWVMIDDGWSDARDKKLCSFAADPDKFPGDLGQTVRRLKQECGVRWVGAWQNIAGYWNGIDPDSVINKEYGQYLHRTRKGLLVPDPDAGKSFAFWREWHSRLKRQGIDFVKVDNQSSLHGYIGGDQSIVKSAESVHGGLEASIALHFGGSAINCMGMATENVWNRSVTSVSRSSNDFLPKLANGFGEHALQNAYNSFYHGPFYWCDWDMFWTEHHDSAQHAVLRAVSGGPLYFSDGPGKTKPDLVRPLIYHDGRIIRCDGVGQPTEDCLTVNPVQTPLPLKIWNKAGGSGVIAAFHIYDGEEIVEGDVGPVDIPDLAGQSFFLFDALAKTVRRMTADERMTVRLASKETKLFLMVPDTGDFTAIGLMDKLVACHAVLEVRQSNGTVKVRLRDGGVFLFVSVRQPIRASIDRKRVSVEKLDDGTVNNVYRIDCSAKRGETCITIKCDKT
ncbi:Sip1-related alpha-galactosidase [Paenibacillus sp. HJGM_3]|uniref:Sip1-related alpha-galactosidase n=1 Tax=Paenibacillus sp. HJGM_3 TaxID=3379816 RepID=UPI00385C95B0